MEANEAVYDLAIIGGGPAAVAAGVYAARKKIKTIFITKDFGGQSVVSDDIQNWVGTVSISGTKLAEDLKKHLEAYAGEVVKIKTSESAEKVEKTDAGFVVKTSKEKYEAKTILIATGSGRRKLNVSGAEKFENKGITYCASCDGPLFSEQDVAVIGGGNAGFETALQLLAYAKSVTLIHRHKEFKADAITIEKARAHANMRIIAHAEPTEVTGEQFVTGLKYKDKDSGEEKELAVSGIFVEAGVLPNTDFAAGLLELDTVKRVKADARNQRTGVDGVWAA